jgi:hypothetical protein
MKIISLEEPELEFGGSQKHIDIRFGLAAYGPLDLLSDLAPRSIRLGLVGTSESIEGFRGWLERCSNGWDAKPGSKQPKLFPAFPSCEGKTAFNCMFVTQSSIQRSIPRQKFLVLATDPKIESRILKAVNLFMDEIDYLAENSKLDVLVCAFPFELIEILDDPEQTTPYDFRDLLKAKSMRSRIPIQVVLPSLYDAAKAKKQKRTGLARTLQDEATRAWNLHCALYYKAGGAPWRLKRDSKDLDTCFVGVSFYRSLDRTSLSTSIAQIFNERGEGVVIRGAEAKASKEDRQPHLEEEDAFNLLREALARYKQTHRNLPARVVVHKTSSFSEGESAGFRQALADSDVEIYDFLSFRKSSIRLYREGVYPPLRGTVLDLEDSDFLIYTRGSVPFFETYPGMYVPRPLRAIVEHSEQTVRFLGQEILALTKLNWNSTQFDGAEPVTIQAARDVGAVLRFCGPDDYIAPRYSSYM